MEKLNRQLIYLGSSKKDLEKMPLDVQELFTAALKEALIGQTHEDAKIFKHYGSGVYEVVYNRKGEAFREIYTVRYEEVVFVVHVFHKKSNQGIKTPKKDLEVIEQRLKWAKQIYKEQYDKKKKAK